MSSLSNFFEKRDKSTGKKDNALHTLLSQENNKKFENLATEQNPSTVVYLAPEPKKEEPQDLTTAIFVGNVPISFKHKDLKKLFSQYGKILKVWFRSIPVEQNKLGKKANLILKQYQDDADSMNGYVKFQTIEQAESACTVNGTKVENHTLRVFLCLDNNMDYQTTIFIGNLPLDIKEEELRTHFQKIGQIINVRVIKDKHTFKGIGIGYVRFANKIDMNTAIQTMSGSILKDRPIRVKRAIQKSKLEKKIMKVTEKKLAKKNYTPPQGQKNYFKNKPANPFETQEDRQKEKARKFHFKRKLIKK